MTKFRSLANKFNDPEEMASKYLSLYFSDKTIKYLISPFKILNDENVVFLIRDFKKLEGVYIPSDDVNDAALVAINFNRPITRQRFTAAHELCHHFRDSLKQISCPIGQKNETERFADAFASALLMPLTELKKQVNKFKDNDGNVSFDDCLSIANYFGVSFEACVYRIAYKIHAIEGDTEYENLKKRIDKYKPDIKRGIMGISHYDLYADLIDNYSDKLLFKPNEKSKYLFENSYIFNDSRMEGLDVSVEQAFEIVTDLRINMQNSEYCKKENECYLSIAGHYKMYHDIFELPVAETISVYELIRLNKDLFSHYPFPEYGGSVRKNNVLVLGAKFETVDYHEIFDNLERIEREVKNYFINRNSMSISEYIKHVARVHHEITVIHPFPDGNGRTSRAFMNLQLVRTGLIPIYVKAEEKVDYFKALEKADRSHEYADLYEFIFKLILRSHVELNR